MRRRVKEQATWWYVEERVQKVPTSERGGLMSKYDERRYGVQERRTRVQVQT